MFIKTIKWAERKRRTVGVGPAEKRREEGGDDSRRHDKGGRLCFLWRLSNSAAGHAHVSPHFWERPFWVGEFCHNSSFRGKQLG